MDIKFYLAVFWRRFPYFLVLVCLGTGAGIAFALTQQHVYVAQARLIVESQQIPSDLAASTVQTNALEQLQIIQQRIFTRDRLLELADDLAIYETVGRQGPELSNEDKVGDLASRINMTTTGGNNNFGRATAVIVGVSFDAPSPQLAADVTNAVVNMILDENTSMRTSVSAQTLEFFIEEVEQLENQLSELSEQMLAFQEANLDSLPDSLEFRRSQQAAAQDRLRELNRNKNQLRDRRSRLIQLFEQTGEVGLVGVEARTAAEAELQELEDELTRASAVLSADNPRIGVLRRQIAALEQIVAAQQAAEGSVGIDADGNPLSPFELQLADIEAQITFIDEQEALINENLQSLADSIAATPGNALTLATLERNFDNLQEQYDRAVANRAAAEVGNQIEALSQGQRITVVEPAIPPQYPDRPNRKRTAAMGVAAGIGLGVGFIVLLEFLTTAVRRPVDLANGLQITPLVTVPYLRTQGQVWRRRLIIAAAVLLVLIGLPAVLWYIDQNVMPLQPLIEDLLASVGLG